jgi:hypothetical protein
MDARKYGARMAVEQAGMGAGAAKNLLVEVPKLRIDGRKRGDRMAFAEGEDILTAAGRISNVQIQKSPVEKRYKGYGGRKSTASVKSVVHRITTLLQREDADIRVLYRE